MKKVRCFVPAFAWGLAILILTNIPGNYIPHVYTFADWLQWDKITHLILFGVFSFALLWGFRKSNALSKTIYGLVFLGSAIYGGLTEYLQSFLDIGRNGNLYDFYANLLGAGLGCLLFFFLTKKQKV